MRTTANFTPTTGSVIDNNDTSVPVRVKKTTSRRRNPIVPKLEDYEGQDNAEVKSFSSSQREKQTIADVVYEDEYQE